MQRCNALQGLVNVLKACCMHVAPKLFVVSMLDVLLLGHAGVHRLPQQHMVLHPGGGGTGAFQEAL